MIVDMTDLTPIRYVRVDSTDRINSQCSRDIREVVLRQLFMKVNGFEYEYKSMISRFYNQQ